jgi:hypothetical protein
VKPRVEVVVTRKTVVTERVIVGGKWIFSREVENENVVISRKSDEPSRLPSASKSD